MLEIELWKLNTEGAKMCSKRTFQHYKNYQCVCGKVFTNSQAFNGHKAHCKQHLLSKGKSFLEQREKLQKEFIKIGSMVNINKQKRAKKQNREKYYKNPAYCVICNKELPWEKRYNKTCSNKCYIKLQHKLQTKRKRLIKGKYTEGRHILYKTVCDIDGSFYVGVHKCKDNFDEYPGSGRYLKNKINKYGKEHFHREVLAEFDNSEDAFKAERILIRDKKLLLNKKCMNLAEGGYGGATHNSEQEYNKNPNYCSVCGKMLVYEKRYNKTCGSDRCLHIARGKNGTRNATARKKYKQNPKLCKVCQEPISWELRRRTVCSEDCLHKLKSEQALNRAKHKRKAVRCKEKNKIFNSILDAAKWVKQNGDMSGKLDTGHISNACRGKAQTAYGYHWEFILDN